MRLEGKVAIVTGAGSGIGEATAGRFAAEGASVVANDIEAASLGATVSGLAGSGHQAVTGDLAAEATAEALAATARDAFGGLDIVVNNAGVFSHGDLPDMAIEEWDRMMATNVRSMFLVLKHGIPLMLESGGGSVVNLASVSAFVGHDLDGETTAVYNVTKAAARQLTTSLATRYASEGIRVNAVAPGPIRTNIMRDIVAADADESFWEEQARDPRWSSMGRPGTPDEVANAILFLASDEASFVTGATLPVDGGFLAG